MHSENLHISDGDLLLMVDGELSARRAAQIRTHLEACWNCRGRMARIEGTIVDFAQAYRETSDWKLPPIDRQRALLPAQLAQLASNSGARSWRWFGSFHSATRTVAVFAMLFIAALVGRSIWQHTRDMEPDVASRERGLVPDHILTPGVTREATLDDLCSAAHEEVVGQVTVSLRKQVLAEYGIVNARASEYEIDYLIAPGLGGAEDIHNLWPQPYGARIWNAYAKDALEERLHQLVCGRELDLAVAQRDIANDWIAAYKKHLDKNVPQPSMADLGSLNRSVVPAKYGLR
jgi:hypothetical protein